MAESIIFRGTHIRYFDGRQEEGGAFVRVHLTSEFTKPVMDAMDWEEPGSSVTDAKLDGELHAINFILTPGDKQLSQHEIQFPIRSVEDFKVVTIEKDEMKRRELRFVVKSPAEGVAALVDNYIRRIGEHQGALKVSYTSQDQLDLQAEKKPVTPKPAKEKTGCKACDAGIPMQEDAAGIHVDGMDCKVWDKANPVEPMQTAILGTAPTTADKKKARQAEEARKRELKTGQGWPGPNEHGVYEASPELTLEFLGKKCAASIEYLNIGPNQWISVSAASTSEGGHSGPLSAGSIYPSREIAIAKEAYAAAERAESAASKATSPALKKQHQAIHDWFVEIFVKYVQDLSEEDTDRDYTVQPEDGEIEDTPFEDDGEGAE